MTPGSGGFCIEGWWHAAVAGKARCSWLWRPLLWLLSLPWGAVVRASHLLYRWRLLRPRKALLPVVSVGNISVGGTGKTTVCMYLAQRLGEMGLKPAIVLRGHRRKSGGALLVSDGDRLLAGTAEAGDEAWLLARHLPGCPVAVATRREAAIGMIAEQTDAAVVLLDDGFQYYRLAREMDLVLLDAYAPPGSYRLVPAGFLREPPSHLVRATDVWITHANLASEEQLAAVERITGHYVRVSVLTEHVIAHITTWEGEFVCLEALQGRVLVAVAGLGNPESFFDLLQAATGATVKPRAFADHHDYSGDDWLKIAEAVTGEKEAAVVTTPKDAVKLPPPPPDLDVFIVHPRLRIQRGEEAVADLLERIVAATATGVEHTKQRSRVEL